MLYKPGGIVLSGVRKIVPTNVESCHLRIPNCRALVKGCLPAMATSCQWDAHIA